MNIFIIGVLIFILSFVVMYIIQLMRLTWFCYIDSGRDINVIEHTWTTMQCTTNLRAFWGLVSGDILACSKEDYGDEVLIDFIDIITNLIEPKVLPTLLANTSTYHAYNVRALALITYLDSATTMLPSSDWRTIIMSDIVKYAIRKEYDIETVTALVSDYVRGLNTRYINDLIIERQGK